MSSKYTKLLMGGAVMAFLPATQAFADGTQAGATVTNTFDLAYEVNGVEQTYVPDADDTVNFTVDRKIDVLVQSLGNVTAAPGEVDVEQVFSVTNQGNDTQSFILSAVQAGSGDDIDTTNVTITVYRDDDGVAGFSAGDTPITVNAGGSYGDIAIDETVFVVVESDVAATATDGQTADISLLAQVAVSGATGTAVAEDTDGNSQEGVAENVFVDDQGDIDADTDGQHSDTSTITVNAADIAAIKQVTLVDAAPADNAACAAATTPGSPVSGDYYIPGACVEYTITITNNGGQAATNIALTDVLDAKLNFISASNDMSGAFTGTSTVGSTTYTGTVPAIGADCNGTSGGTCDVVMINGTVAAASGGTAGEGELVIRARVK